MTRYWFEFDLEKYKDIPYGIVLGCGITAYNYEDALSILLTKVFVNKSLPKVLKMIEDVDLRKLDHNHVLPNMAPVNLRGVWFPLGYE